MKIKRFFMEDWLIQSKKVVYNLSESGCQDYKLKDFMEVCGANINEMGNVFLGDNVPWGSERLREQIANSYQTIGPNDIMVSNGTSEALFAYFNTILEPGDEVIIPFPAFQALYEVPKAIGCNVKFLRLKEKDSWKINLDELKNLVTHRTKLIIINTPHNPFGWTLSEEEMLNLVKVAQVNDAYLLFDEHYRFLSLNEGTKLLPSGYDVCRYYYKKTYATGSMIKCFGIVGIRIGWLIGDHKVLRQCIDYKDYLTHTIPEITDYLAFIALKNKEKLIADKKKDILPNIELFDKFMEANSSFLEYMKPSGGVICFPKLKQHITATRFCKVTLNKFKVSLLPGFTFETDNYFRINFGLQHEKFKEAIDLLQLSINDFKNADPEVFS